MGKQPANGGTVMRSSRLRGTMFASVALAVAVMSTGGVFAVPLFEGFETQAVGAAADFGAVTFGGVNSVAASDVREGNRAVIVGDGDIGQMDLTVDPLSVDEVWIMTYIKPQPTQAALLVTDDNNAITFAVDTNFNVTAYSGSAWVVLDIANPVTEDAWLGFAVRANFNSEKWDLYIASNGTFNAELSEMVRIGKDLAFNAAYNGAGFTNLTISSSGGPAIVDALAVSPAYNSVALGADDMDNLQVILRASDGLVGQPPYAYALAADKKFAGALGDDLAIGLPNAAGAEVYTSGGNFASYTWDGSEWSGADFEVPAGRGITLSGISSPGAAFYPFDTLPVASSEVVGGDEWNPLVWPSDQPASTVNQNNNLGFSGLADNGDWLVIVDGGKAKYFQWGGGQWNAWGAAANASYQVPKNKGFWYRRGGATDDWTP